MVKAKTSIYVNKELWERFKRHALSKGLEVSSLLEDIMNEEMAEETISNTLLKLAGSENHEVDFEPIKPRQGLVSELVRAVRDERRHSISR